MHADETWDLLVGYVAGEGSAEERAALEAWIAEDEAREHLLGEARSVWAALHVAPAAVDVDAAWQRLEARRRQDARDAPVPIREERKPRRRATHQPARKVPPVSRYAAVLILAVVSLVALVEWGLPLGDADPAAQVFATQRGQRTSLVLPDGSMVYLSVESRLVVPAEFSEDVREVQLSGEAYFDVTHDAARPFVVRAGNVEVRVLGTAFDVQAYAAEQPVQVVVAEGRVAIGATGAAAQSAVVEPGQMARLSAAGEVEVVSGVSLEQYLAWKEGRLVFDDTPFPAVVARLERWYDVQIEIDEVALGTVDRLNAAFSSEPVADVVRDIALALSLEYDFDRGKVRFYR